MAWLGSAGQFCCCPPLGSHVDIIRWQLVGYSDSVPLSLSSPRAFSLRPVFPCVIPDRAATFLTQGNQEATETGTGRHSSALDLDP